MKSIALDFKNNMNCDFGDYDAEYENAMELLASIGVPFSPDGTPLGIGWDD